jgi:RNA polymerase sigma-70 factor, ECF subfamily
LKLSGTPKRILGAMDEHTIIQSVINGDIDQFEQLVSRYHVGVIIHCERLTGDRQTAEDIAQDAFIKAFERIREFDGTKSRFSTWLYKIATNKALDHLRAQKRVMPSENIEELADMAAPDYAAEEERKIVRNAVAALQPPTHRQVVEAYYWHGKSYQEIADELSVPINTVRTWLRRAKTQLRSDLS